MVTVRANIPGFGNHFGLAQNRVLGNGKEEWTMTAKVPLYACHGRGQVKTEAVDLVLFHPETQGIHGQPESLWTIKITGVATAAVVKGVEFAVGVVHMVIVVFCQTAHTEKWSIVSRLTGVVKHHIHNHFNTGSMQLPDHGFHLDNRIGYAIAWLRGHKAERVIAPIVFQPQPDQPLFTHFGCHW